MPIRILLADDSPAVLESVRALLERDGFEVLGEASDGRGLVDLAVSLRPAVVILGYSMPAMRALDAARDVLTLCPETRMILLSHHAAENQIIKAFQVGIRGYVEEADATSALGRAIRDVSGGRLFLSDGASRRLAEAYLPEKVAPPSVLPIAVRRVRRRRAAIM